MKKQHIDDDDLRKIIEKAHQLTAAEQNKLSLEDVKKTAEELGISPQKVNMAYEMLEEEKRQKLKDKKRSSIFYTQVITFVIVISAIFYWGLKPSPKAVPYQGKVKMLIASSLNGLAPKNDLKEVKLFQHSKIYSFFRLMDVKKSLQIEWKFIDPTGEIFDQNKQQIVPDNGTAIAKATLNLPISAPIGDWKVQLWVEDKLYQIFPLKVSYGHFDALLTSKLGTSERKTPAAEDVKDTYIKGKDELVLCYLYWGLISKERIGEVAWKWIDPDGNIAREGVLQATPSLDVGWYRANHGLTIDKAKAGNWKVEVYYDDIKISTLPFTIK